MSTNESGRRKDPIKTLSELKLAFTGGCSYLLWNYASGSRTSSLEKSFTHPGRHSTPAPVSEVKVWSPPV